MRKLTTFLALLTFCGLFLAGCASSLSGDVYSRNEARTAQTVTQGVITNIRVITVEGTDSGVGKIGGAIIGGVIGSRLNHGNGPWAIIGGTAGAIGGGVAGSAVEERLTRTQALEITVREDSGRVIAVVQEPNSRENFNVGDRVRIITGARGAARISH